jgi:hypothetical protein
MLEKQTSGTGADPGRRYPQMLELQLMASTREGVEAEQFAVRNRRVNLVVADELRSNGQVSLQPSSQRSGYPQYRLAAKAMRVRASASPGNARRTSALLPKEKAEA